MDKLKKLSFDELCRLKDVVNEIILRTHISGTPSPRWHDFNKLLTEINRMIENFIYEEYIK